MSLTHIAYINKKFKDTLYPIIDHYLKSAWLMVIFGYLYRIHQLMADENSA